MTASPHTTLSFRPVTLYLTLSLLIGVLVVANLLAGDSYLAPGEMWRALTGEAADEMTPYILAVRAVRLGVAVLAGIALSVSGLQMQTIFRNPLADPYLLGVSSGAGLGVALFILGAPLLGLASSSWMQTLGLAGAGWAGASLVLVGVAVLSHRVKNVLGVLIVGVMIGYVAGALIQILQYLSAAEQLKIFTLWSMGSLGHITAARLWVMIPVIAAGLLLAVASVKPLNLLLLGESYAATMGLNVRRARTMIFLSTMLLTGTVTAFCGPIGFLGLAVPHVARFLTDNADHRVLLPVSVLLGVAAMLLCDLAAKTLVLPVNCVTALLGVPVILWVVFKNMNLR